MRTLFFIIFIHLFFTGLSQDSLVIAFYNTENLFDTIKDIGKLDGEYLPSAQKGWNTQKYNHKLHHISRTILALNNWKGADIIGLCEVENSNVLSNLISQPILAKQAYDFIHFESPDRRGIDVTLLYKTISFTPIIAEGIEVGLPSKHPTRLILYVEGMTKNQDTLHLFVNHWPSNYSGVFESQQSRMAVAQKLHSRIQQIIANNSNAKIILMGDFNNEPNNPSIQTLLASNLVVYPSGKTHKYQEEWSQLDFFMLSKTAQQLLEKAEVFKTDWLLKKDQRFLGEQPYRTFMGKNYLGGYSDHLPIKMNLRW